MKFSIIRETKNDWERRTPLTPENVAQLCGNGLDISAVKSPIRIYPDARYTDAGAQLVESTADANVVLGIKEPPIDQVGPGQVFIVFSHTIKGQAYNMPLLRRFLDQGATLIDYECIVDALGRRLIAFGRYAGIAGAIDGVWALRRRMEVLGIPQPLAGAERTHVYTNTERAWSALEAIGGQIREQGFAPSMAPVVFGIIGCGKVGQGAGEVLDHLGAVPVQAADLGSLDADPHKLYRVDLVEQDLYERKDGGAFVLQEYYDHPELHRCVADVYLDHLTMLINTAYWAPQYPRAVTRESLRRFGDSRSRMLVISDVACDVRGSVEATVRCTDLDEPFMVFDPETGEAPGGLEGRGIVIGSVDNLPCELSEQASTDFGRILQGLLPQLATADLNAELDEAGLPDELKSAVITWRGQLTPKYLYLNDYLNKAR